MNKFFTSKFTFVSCVALAFIPIVFYTWVIGTFAVNVPFFDDFFWAFEFIKKYKQTSSFAEKAQLVFSQHNQHRIVYFRIILVGLFKAFCGQINFKTLVLIGNLSIYGVALIWLLSFRKSAFFILSVATVFFWWFQLQYYHNSLLSYGVPNLSVIFFGIAALFFGTQKPKLRNIILASILGIMAMFSNGNGILILPILVGIQLLIKHWKLTTYYLILCVAFLNLYFWNYTMNHSEVHLNMRTFNYFFEFLGIAFFPHHETFSRYFALLSYGIILGGFIIFIGQTLKQQNPKVSSEKLFLLALFLFLTGTSLMTALVRSFHNLSIPTWYKNYSLLYILVVFRVGYLYFKNPILQLRWVVSILLIGMGVWFSTSKAILPSVASLSSTLRADAYNFKNHKFWLFLPKQVGKSNYNYFNHLTSEFIEKGHYLLPKLNQIETHLAITHTQKLPHFKISHDKKHEISLVEALLNKKTFSLRNSYGVLYSDSLQKVYLFGKHTQLAGKKNMLRHQVLWGDKVSFAVSDNYFSTSIKEGAYTLGFIELYTEKTPIFAISDQSITIENI